MPRSVPGVYSVIKDDKFIEALYVVSDKGERLARRKDGNDAPRWYFTNTQTTITRIE